MNIISNRWHYNALTGNLDAENDTIKVALMTSSYVVDKDTNIFSDTHEISATGYTAGGKVLANSVVTQDDANDLAKWDADDVVWDPSTITARYAVMYNTTRADSIIGVYDFLSDMTSSNGPFAVRWNAAGVLALSQA